MKQSLIKTLLAFSLFTAAPHYLAHAAAGDLYDGGLNALAIYKFDSAGNRAYATLYKFDSGDVVIPLQARPPPPTTFRYTQQPFDPNVEMSTSRSLAFGFTSGLKHEASFRVRALSKKSGGGNDKASVSRGPQGALRGCG